MYVIIGMNRVKLLLQTQVISFSLFFTHLRVQKSKFCKAILTLHYLNDAKLGDHRVLSFEYKYIIFTWHMQIFDNLDSMFL